MTAIPHERAILPALDDETRALVRLSAIITAGAEHDIRSALSDAKDRIRAVWVEELLLQTYLFAGFPRALNAAREWRRLTPAVPGADPHGDADAWRERGTATCATVYGPFYERLRANVRALHPLLDEWMINEGYGKVLSRPELDLPRRELCIVAACAAAAQERQLHSHFHGALNAGAGREAVDAVVASLDDLLEPEWAHRVRHLWSRVRGVQR